MKTYIRAKLVGWRKIDVIVFTDIPRPESFNVVVYKNHSVIKKATISKLSSINIVYFFDITLNEDYELGASYSLLIGSLPLTTIDISDAVDFPDFDERYAYDGDDLGAIYQKDKTDFALWAPLAEFVNLKLINPDGEINILPMNRTNNGVYRLTVHENILNYKYHYIVNNNGVISETNDPYAKGTSLNSEYSVVIDYDSLLSVPNIKPETPFENYVDAIIYETHIRDINEGNNNDVVNKGKYLGFVEEGRKTKGGHPAGLDYIKYLGVTHVQIQPVLDFNSIDDVNTKKWYNWGYDPISFFSLEGSYSIKPEDAVSRLYEFREMVDKLHKNGLRIVLDVVYNHIYEYENSVFEKIVPHYYFRKRRNGSLANASGCGNDFASERKMARKIILDSVKYLFSHFDIDGLRFDLMGLLDIDTVKETYKIAKSYKKDLIFYGEGWNLGDELPFEQRANKENYSKLKEFGFFNDTYRDIVKGPSSSYSLKEKGYICGNTSYQYGLDYAFHAGVLNLSYEPMFDNANQSINYLECHDNNTLFDKLLVSNAYEEEKMLLDRVDLANSILLLSYGVPFVHMGQEIGLSKDGLDNTYNTLGINNLDYRLVDERFDMVNRFRFMNSLRKKLRFLKNFKREDMKDFFEISHWDNGIYVLAAAQKNVYCQEKEFVIMFNPTDNPISFELDDYYSVLDGNDDELSINIKNGFLPGRKRILLLKK